LRRADLVLQNCFGLKKWQRWNNISTNGGRAAFNDTRARAKPEMTFSQGFFHGAPRVRIAQFCDGMSGRNVES
jgi:hypothetical protein